MYYFFRMLIIAVFAIQNNSIVSQTVDCNNLPTDFHFIKQVNVACSGDSLTFIVNDIGADRYYWTIPNYMGTYITDEQFIAGVRIQGTWTFTMRPLSIFGQYRYAINNRPNYRITYSPTLAYEGLYRVFISYFVQENNKRDVPVTVVSNTGTTQLNVDQTVEPEDGIWHNIGTFSFSAGNRGSVTISTDGMSDEFVIADAVRFELISFADDTSINLFARTGIDEVICVEAQFSNCPQRVKTCTNPISIGSNLKAPEIIRQDSSVCRGESYLFEVNDNGAESFIWHLPSGMSIDGQFGNVPVNEKQVMVHMENAQGDNMRIGVSSLIRKCSLYSDTSYTNVIRFNSPNCPLADPEFVNQPKEICIGVPVLYSVTKVDQANEYEWTIPEGLQEINTGRTGIFRTTEPQVWLSTNVIRLFDRISVQAYGEAIHPSMIVHTNDSISSVYVPNPQIEISNVTNCIKDNGEIKLTNLEKNKTYTVSYYFENQLTYLPNTISDPSGNILIANLPAGKFDSIKVSLSECFALYEEAVYIGAPELIKIKNVNFEKSFDCKKLNKVVVSLENSSDGQLYEVDFENDGIFENNVKSINNILTIENIEHGTLIENVSIRNPKTGCISNSDFQYFFPPITLAAEDLQCIPEYKINILWDENESTYAFTEQDKKIIPTITKACLKEKSIISFSLETGSIKQSDEFLHFRIPSNEDQILFWQVTDDLGNSQTCETIIKFHYEHKVPSAISPNGDGINDTWQIDFLQKYPNCNISIFNRIGIKIFESKKGYPQNWDGTQGGVLVPVDTYYYVISLGENGIIYKGTLSIVY